MLEAHEGMYAFGKYADSLANLARKAANLSPIPPGLAVEITNVLDGQPSARLRELVPLSTRRSMGAFFTGSTLADAAVGPALAHASAKTTVLDPACGVGDLLTASARYLPLRSGLTETVRAWGDQIHGFDINPEFIRAAKARLILLAISRGARMGDIPLPPLERLFPNLTVGDGLGVRSPHAVSHIVLNPPFFRAPAPPGYKWGSGLVTQAAVFMDYYVTNMPHGVSIIAILPDVLRTGSNYRRWRDSIDTSTAIDSIDIFGAFDNAADVDVFLLRLKVGGSSERSVDWWKPPTSSTNRHIGDYFDVRVGSVVPHRDQMTGRSYPYIHTRLLPKWGSLDVRLAEMRQFGRRTFRPPFVVVRRTSAPRDRERAIGTIVTGDHPVAVENHLLVLEPRDRSMTSCQELISILHDDRTQEWLRDRIRCRHLTVSAVRELPWWNVPDAN